MPTATPVTLAGFSPEWMTEELRRTGVLDVHGSVTSVDQEILGVGEGFMGEIARLTLEYADADGPASMIAKIPTTLEPNRGTGRALGVYEREVRLYGDVLPSLGLPLPHIFTASYEALGTEGDLLAQMIKADRLPYFLLRRLIRREQADGEVPPCVLLMEDLGHHEVGDQVAGADANRIERVLDVAARLHAATWGDKAPPRAHWLQGPDIIPRIFHAMYLNGRREFERLAAPVLSPEAMDIVKALRKTGRARITRLHEASPRCLLHGDLRLDNMFFDTDGSVAALFDWQASNLAPAVLDIGYLMVSSLDAATPEPVVDELLATYHGRLISNGVDNYPLDRLLADYAEGLLLLLHRMPALTDAIDLGDGRGLELMDVWLRGLNARLARLAA